jgi:hypothetical protein
MEMGRGMAEGMAFLWLGFVETAVVGLWIDKIVPYAVNHIPYAKV